SPFMSCRYSSNTSLALSSGKYTSLLFSLPFQRVNNAGTNFSIQELSFNPVGTTPTYNRGVTAANFANAPSDYLYSNEALEFDGDYDSYAAIPSNGLNNMSGAMTIEAWINVNGASAVNQYIFHKYIGGSGYRMLVTNTMKLSCIINGTVYETSQTLFYSRWYHVAWVISAAGATSLYINGELDSYYAATGFPTAHNDSLYIGRGFNGFIDEVRMFKYERTAGDIKKFIDMPMEQ
ncbi:MAG TPA: LamG domain-containing protein, partial [Ignavibacteria bacterium]|nr:LamG domain-containing protein [Ignavibacteria bacterium]